MSSPATERPIWEVVKAELARQLPKDVFELWFKPIRCLREDADNLVLSAPNDFAAIWIHDNYLDLISRRACIEIGHSIEVSIGRQESEPVNPSDSKTDERREEVSRSLTGALRTVTRENRKSVSGTLNPRNTFENFVVGSSNQLAHAAVMAVVQAPAHAYNPLFIYGETGLGKTHLMHAVGHSILKINPQAKIAYLSSEKFTNEFIHGIQENTLTRFRKRYRNVDVLLLDDVQFLSGKERIQEEFFHTFNDLFESQKQIFLSSDRPANEIARLESRLVSRFQWGLMADIQSPDFETRVAILRAKASTHRFEINSEIIDFIAQHIVHNIRRLEGALIKVASYSSLTGKQLNIATVEELLRDVLMEEAQRLITVDGIQKRVADYYQLRPSDMVSKRRPANIAFPRQIAMYLSRILTKHSLQEIGENFGGRDHGTVIHACRSVENMMEQDQSVRNSVEFLKTQLSK
jgi:chromosomal replication initiator protein